VAKLDDIIAKSLEDLDQLASEAGTNLIVKAEPQPNEISDNAPDEEEEDSETPTEEAEEGQEGEEDEMDEDEPGEDAEKSLEDELTSDDSVRKALEVSEFLAGLIKGLSAVLDGQKDSLNKSLEASTQSSEILAKSFQGILKSQRAVLETQSELSKSIRRLSKRMETIESQPQARKSVTSVVEKSFKASIGDNAPATLSKSEVLAKLTLAHGAGNHALLNDILSYESMGDMRVLSPEAMAIVTGK